MKKGFIIILSIFTFMVTFILFPRNIYAAQFKVEKSTDTIKPGAEVTVFIKATDVGADSIKEYNLNLAYDTSRLDFKSKDEHGVSSVSQSNPINIVKLEGSNTINSDSTVATIVFTAKANPGDANLSLSSASCKTIGNKDCDAPKSSMVKIAALSSDANLSSLKIPNATISPKFDKNVTDYTTTIQDITEVTVNAISSDPNSKISISDNYKNLQKGDNEIKITVTAEDGKNSKTYKIKVTLKLTPTDEELLKASSALENIKIKGFNLDFAKELKKYNLIVPYKIKKLDIDADAENPKAIVQIDGNKNLKVGRNIVKIDVTSEDEQNKSTYTINVTRDKQVKKVVQTCPDVTSKNEWIIFSVCMILTFTLGIVLGYYLSKKEVLQKLFKKREKKKNEEKLSDTIEIPDLKDKKTKK